jgi:calmodulin
MMTWHSSPILRSQRLSRGTWFSVRWFLTPKRPIRCAASFSQLFGVALIISMSEITKRRNADSSGSWSPHARKLSPQEAARCREAFVAFDGGTGEVPLRTLRSLLQRLSVYPSEENLFTLISTHDPGGRGFITLDGFLSLVADYQTMGSGDGNIDTAALDAFVALGGNRDQSGVVSTEKLRHAVRWSFALPIDIDRLIKEADTDNSGFIDFEEFLAMLR